MKNIKSLTLIISALWLSGCGGSASVPAGGGASGSINEGSANNAAKTVVISPVATIPTNGGSIGTHYLKVHNNTAGMVKLENFNLTKSANTSMISKVYNSVNRSFGGYGYDKRVNIQDCTTLASGATCSIPFTPDAKDGAAGIQLKFKGVDGKTVTAAQLINYSQNVPSSNGFIVSNDNIANVKTTNNYSVTIPFMADDNYKSVKVSSRVTRINQSVSCANGLNKGSHCTAILTMPAAAKASSYANTIKINGERLDGSVNSATLSSGSTYGEIGLLTLSNGPLLIIPDKQGNNTKGSIFVVNNGTQDATLVNSKINSGSSWLNGNISNISYLQSGGMICNGSPVVQGSTVPSGSLCEVLFALTNPDASGFDDFEVSYNDGVNQSVFKSTKIYYRGAADNTGYGGFVSYRLEGNLDFSNTLVSATSSGITKTITVVNDGFESLAIGNLVGLPTGVGFSIQSTSCNARVLQKNDKCYFNILYKPNTAVTASSVNLRVDITTNNDKTTIVNPIRYIPVNYSAVDTINNNSVVILNNNVSFLVNNNGTDITPAHIIRIQNLGNDKYTINGAKILNGSWPSGNKGNLIIKAPAILSTGESNPLANVTFTLGEAANIARDIAGGKTAELIYIYGNVTDIVDDFVIQEFSGTFGAANSANHVVVNYKSDAEAITVVPVPTESEEIAQNCPDNDCVGLALVDGTNNTIKSVLASGSEFTLLKTNIVRAKFTYRNGKSDKNDFLVNDAGLPYGFMVDKNLTTCPTASKYSTPRQFAANRSCDVVYYFLDTGLNNAFFYTAAANASERKISIPPYSMTEGNSTRVVDLNQELRFTANAFAGISVVASEVNNPSISLPANEKVYSLIFSASNLTTNVMVNPVFNNVAVRPVGAVSCNLVASANPRCTLEVVVPDTLASRIPLIYSLANNSDYNAIASEITINP